MIHFLHKNVKAGIALFFILFVMQSTQAQNMMPLPAHSSVYSGIYARGLWFIAPTNFTITGLRVAPEAGTGLQYIHLMKLFTAPNGSTTGSTTFTTLAYLSGGANNTVLPVGSIQVMAGDMIGIMGTVTGICNSYAASAAVTSDIAGFPVYLNRFGTQGSIESGPAPTYWGNTNATAGQIGRIFMYYSTKSGTNNAGVMSIPSPTNFCSGVQEIKARIANKGLNRIDSVRVEWTLDGIPQPTVFWNSPLDTSGSLTLPSDTLISLDTATFLPGVSRDISVWTSMPNGVTDTTTHDDSVIVTRKSSLNGTFTVGGSNPDYPTLAAVATDLNNYGVCGPVKILVRTGSYSGQFTLGNISGASLANTIYFGSEANHVDSVSIGFTATAATENYIVKLTGASYVKFENLKFVASAASFSRIFDITGGSMFDTIQGCSLISATATASSVNTAVVYTDGNQNSGLVVMNNLIQGGSWGFRLYGGGTAAKVVGMVAQGNTFLNQYIYGIYSYYHQNSKIRNNTFSSNSTATYYGILSYYADSSLEITGNRMSGISLGYGIYTYYNYGSAAQPVIIANNAIILGGTGVARPIHSYYSTYNRIYNNSFLVTSTSTTTGYAGYFYYSATTYNNNEVKNNVFANTGGGYAVYSYNPTLAGGNNIFDNNLYYTSGSTLAQIGTPASTPANLATWRTASNQDWNSISYRPAFTSSTNLTPNPADTAAWAMNGRATHSPLVPVDINGTPRPETFSSGIPDLGAYEFTPTSLAPLATLVGTLSAGSTQYILMGSDSVGRIVWDASASIPSSISVRQYTGERPPATAVAMNNYMYAYLDIDAPAGTSGYTLYFFYKDNWIGTNPSQSHLCMAQKSNAYSTSSWLAYIGSSSTLDSVRNILSANISYDYGLFSGTNSNDPLPVQLAGGLKAERSGIDVQLTWITASEMNSHRFDIEMSEDGVAFHSVGTVKSAGNSSKKISYGWVHTNAFTEPNQGLYYRLRMVDRNEEFVYSNTAKVTSDQGLSEPRIFAMPNPFAGNTRIVIQMNSDEPVTLSLSDITGRVLSRVKAVPNAGFAETVFSELNAQPAGMYFVAIEGNKSIPPIKLHKAD